VLCNEEWRATRRGEVGDKEGLLLQLISSTVNDGDNCYTYVLSSSSRRLIASCTAESHRFAAAMRSLREPKVYTALVCDGTEKIRDLRVL
jgi:hypothetical protein